MMLVKKTRTPQGGQSGNQRMSDSASESSLSSDADRKTRGNSLFALPGLFVGISKGLPDSDPSRSPTSPLDCRVFSGLGNYLARSPRSPDPSGPRWDCEPIRLGLLDALVDECAATSCGRVQGSSGSRNMLLGSQMRIRNRELKTSFDRLLAEEGSSASPRSLPKNYVISSRTRTILPVNLRWGSPETGVELPGTPFEPGEPGKIRSFSADVDGLIWGLSSGVLRVSPFSRPFTNNGRSSGSPPTSHGFVGSLSASDIEQSEDYTCIISRGPNPKTTHIFGDRILESRHASDSSDSITTNRQEDRRGSSWMVTCSEEPVGVPFPSEDFLRVCYSCKKKLEGKDIYMYRGEKAFCSCSCRSQEVMDEEGVEDPAAASHASPGSSFCEDFFPPA